jgi:uncharacterized iron-regulated membrane protein
LIHRYAGLLMAGFLFMSGITGAIISWDHELDDLLNPHLHEVSSRGTAMSAIEIARQVEARDPRVRVTFLPLATSAGESLGLGVVPRVDSSTRRAYEPGYNEVFIDPITGDELGRREWGGVWPVTRENLVSFLYVLHYSLHLPEIGGIDRWGMWLMGLIAVIWMLDSFVGFYLTLPARWQLSVSRITPEAPDEPPAYGKRSWWQRWRPAWNVRWSGGSTRRNFDLHRAFSLWTWLLLFILAFTAFSLNLYAEVFYPLMSKVSKVTPSPFDLRSPHDKHNPIEPRMSYTVIIDRARDQARQRGWSAPLGSVFYAPDYGIYGASFFNPGEDHGAAGVGPPVLYFDGEDGRLLGDRQPWKGTAADLFVQAQFPMHSGRILGLPGRILISMMGLVVSMLSVTGVLIWWKKRRSRVRRTTAEVFTRREGVRP